MEVTWADIADWMPELLSGLWVSLKVTFGSLVLGLPLGLLLALGTATKARILRAICLVIVEAGRGAPALVILQFVYFGLPSAGLTIGSYTAAIGALAWNTAAYTSEMIRAGLESVPFGQREASAAMGFTRLDTLRYVLAPQGLRVATPALLGFSILVFQGTSLCFTIALPEMLSHAYEIGSSTFLYFPVLVLAGLLYAAICIPGSLCVAALERRVGRYAARSG